ncbi:hypothetical protein MIND_01183800 [Mycena indigotica]|uniref:Uncharacterized protein n=1 Tax=Mycena indigotica TaxID=2126181 RepID=A0A8H6VWL9_9AGAR|nr:uncharacterized protein MIND_01183800 [Mycena indigotica]KAF7292848.1 hypothetical protein MIND_01183800 [Mycena indigotica]
MDLASDLAELASLAMPNQSPKAVSYSDKELEQAGLLGEDVSPLVKDILQEMREKPGQLNFSLFALQCANKTYKWRKASASVSASPPPESICGITGANDDHPDLIYRSDALTNPSPHTQGGLKAACGVWNTRLNEVWHIVLPQICDLVVANGIDYTSISAAHFGGPPVVWVAVSPGSVSSDKAHDVSELILAVLRENGDEDTTVEWTEAVSFFL